MAQKGGIVAAVYAQAVRQGGAAGFTMKDLRFIAGRGEND
jgi:hypothetical protein